MSEQRTIAVIGGTGAEGSGLALRWANAGHRVFIGSRDAAKAKAAADELNAILGKSALSGATNGDAVALAHIVVLTVPYASQLSTVEGLAGKLEGKILVDVTVPLVPPKFRPCNCRRRTPRRGGAADSGRPGREGGLRLPEHFRAQAGRSSITRSPATCWCAATTRMRV